jgi:hypothetical protein
MALSKQAHELLDAILGKTANRSIPSPGAGQKLTQTAKGTWELVPDIRRFEKSLSLKATTFIKSMVEPAKSELVKSHLGGRQIATITNHFAIASDLAGKIQKRAPQTLLTETELLGATSLTVPAKPRSESGLSDADIQILEQEITSGNPALAPQEATKLFLQSYRVIAQNMGRRLTAGD